ncbi:hypothetical protein LCGC14_0540190 [marine sediment metagenome]|uniref:Uncharacterized protein n=1 Tax=marine sediment metagenome TaxID=412755 RepID=A0A0F9SBG4_9ZZZZ
MTNKNCQKHKKSVIYTYNDINYCPECLDKLFKAIYKAKNNPP